MTVTLAIETSCDETSIAIIKGKKDILINLISSQIKTHKKYGGVVPEIASRLHAETIHSLIEQALKNKFATSKFNTNCSYNRPWSRRLFISRYYSS